MEVPLDRGNWFAKIPELKYVHNSLGTFHQQEGCLLTRIFWRFSFSNVKSVKIFLRLKLLDSKTCPTKYKTKCKYNLQILHIETVSWCGANINKMPRGKMSSTWILYFVKNRFNVYDVIEQFSRQIATYWTHNSTICRSMLIYVILKIYSTM